MSLCTYMPNIDSSRPAGRAPHHSQHATPAYTVRVEAAAFRAPGTINRPEKEASGTVSICCMC